MSFLDSVLSSIETGKPSSIPPASTSLSAPVSSSTAKAEVRKPATPSRDAPSDRKNVVTGMKRKAEESLPRPQKPATQQVPARPAVSRPTSTSAPSKPRPVMKSTTTKPAASSSAPAAQKAPPAPAKAPPKGSYADLMAQAKALQEKAPTQVGMFKHQAVPKEKLSKMERKKRMMEAQAKEKDARLGKKSGAAAASAKPGDKKLGLKRSPEEPTYKGTARPTPSAAPQPEYRGTAGLPSKRNPNERRGQQQKKSRMDDYLGTDEEDEGDYADDYDDYYSESSDMEAGLDDVETEEAAALKAARREDEEELAAELAAKQQKLDRRKKLTSLASARR